MVIEIQGSPSDARMLVRKRIPLNHILKDMSSLKHLIESVYKYLARANDL